MDDTKIKTGMNRDRVTVGESFFGSKRGFAFTAKKDSGWCALDTKEKILVEIYGKPNDGGSACDGRSHEIDSSNSVAV